MSYVERPGKPVFRHGKRIEMVELVPASSPPRQRKPFNSQFVQVPKTWVAALAKAKSASAYQLALIILDKEFERRQTGKEIVLSQQVTGMPHTTRRRATQELINLSLISLDPGIRGKSAPRVLTVHKLKAP